MRAVALDITVVEGKGQLFNSRLNVMHLHGPSVLLGQQGRRSAAGLRVSASAMGTGACRWQTRCCNVAYAEVQRVMQIHMNLREGRSVAPLRPWNCRDSAQLRIWASELLQGHFAAATDESATNGACAVDQHHMAC